MLNGVLFDLDGVIIDSHPIHRRAWERFLVSVGATITQQELNVVTQGGKREDILRHFLGPLTPEQVAEYGHRKELLFREEALEIRPVCGITEFLQQLEAVDIPVGLASCASRARVQYVLDRLGWSRRFKAVITGDDVIRGKPDPAIFCEAASELEVQASDIVVFEDAVAGVEAAIAAGMKAVGVNTNGICKALLAAGASHVVPDFCAVSVEALNALLESTISS